MESGTLKAKDEKLNRLIGAIFSAHEEEPIGCDECSSQFDCLVDMVMRGAKVGELIPAVEEHLRCCHECDEEFTALLHILQAEEKGATHLRDDSRES